MRQVSLGFTIEHPNDDDANYFFKVEIINKLRDHKLIARLSYNTQLQREIYIINVPQESFDKIDGHINVELEARNQISLL